MKSSYGAFQGNTAHFDISHLCDMIYDHFEDMGLEITYLRWIPEKKRFDVAFEEAHDS